MDYNLAKELKDAGFPQKVNNGDLFYSHSHELQRHGQMCGQEDYERYDGHPNLNEILVPSLITLIEQCGDKFYGIFTVKEKEQIKVDCWVAVHREGYLDDLIDIPAYGATPEIAMAKLWLCINKK